MKISVSLDSIDALGVWCFSRVPRHCSWDHQTQQNTHTHVFLGLTVLFTSLKIILLQCFQQ